MNTTIKRTYNLGHALTILLVVLVHGALTPAIAQVSETTLPINQQMYAELPDADKKLITQSQTEFKGASEVEKLNIISGLVEALSTDDMWHWYNNALQQELEVLVVEHPDSFLLKKQLANAKSNTAFYENSIGDVDNALKHFEEVIIYQLELGDTIGAGNSINNVGTLHAKMGDTRAAILSFDKSRIAFQSIGYDRGLAISLNNLGYLYKKVGMISQALEVYNASLRIKEKSPDKLAPAKTLSNIAALLYSQGDTVNALLNYKRVYDLRKAHGKLRHTGIILNNMGLIHLDKEEYGEAESHFLEALATDSAQQNHKGLSFSFNNLAVLYRNQQKFDASIEANFKALAIRRRLKETKGMAVIYSNLAEVYLTKGETKIAKLYADSALKLAKTLGYPENIKDAARILTSYYEEVDNYESAYDMLQLYHKMKDSVLSIASRQATINFEVHYETAKARASDSLEFALQFKIDRLRLNEQRAKYNAEQARSTIYIVVVALIGLFSIILGWRFKISLSQKRLISIQNKELNERAGLLQLRNEEVTESLSFAETIQLSLLTSPEYWGKMFTDHFIFFKPKDQVSGDFYWAYETEQGDKIWLVADCTGHGVAAAFLSIIGNNLLNEIIIEQEITDCGKILDELRAGVIRTLQVRQEEVKQNMGMDICICKLDKNKKLTYAGAKNPAFIVRDQTLTILEPDPQPIGEYPIQTPFVTQSFNIQPGDFIYLCSDGYMDQFGGPNNKKLKRRPFLKLLTDHSDKSASEQKKNLDTFLKSWIKSGDQIDDICVVGIQV